MRASLLCVFLLICISHGICFTLTKVKNAEVCTFTNAHFGTIGNDFRCEDPDNVAESHSPGEKERAVCICPLGRRCHESGGLGNTKIYYCESPQAKTNRVSGLYLPDSGE